MLVEEKILSGLASIEGVDKAIILDSEGFSLFTQGQSDDGLEKMLAVLEAGNSDMATITSQHAILIARKLHMGNTLVLRCQESVNLGAIRKSIEESATRLNSLW